MKFQDKDISSPNTINIIILIYAAIVWGVLLSIASHTEKWWVVLICAFLFSFNNNTLFSLLHEGTHAVLHSDKKMNLWMGRMAAMFFPTGFTFQKICHLNHHRNNRTDSEMFEAYYPNDNKFIKSLQLYCILGGVYWMTVLMTWMAVLILPSLLKIKMFKDKANKVVEHTGAQSYFGLFDNNKDINTIRLELVGTILFQVLIFKILNLSFWPVFICYYAFALNWGGLQYADHAYTPRDIRYGAWNLSVGPLSNLLYLNYHYHAVHHEYPHLPWIHLPKFYDENKSPKKSYWKIYFKLWQGPVPTTEPSPKAIDNDFDNLIMNGLTTTK
jgi:fatty acid desaturase